LTPILLTGVAGFIGYHLAQRLLNDGFSVVGVDCLSDYYDPQLKRDRLDLLLAQGMEFRKLDLSHRHDTQDLFREFGFEQVIHLAAQAGVRYSLTNPHAYTSSNIEGFLNVLEGCRSVSSHHLLYASSSSVYGSNRKLPFSTQDLSDTPVSLYGATKKANELMAHSYAWMYGLPCTGLRFFTVYGPWGRPDMALYLFASAILEDRPLSLFNHGKMMRDFTYVDDVVESLVRLLTAPPQSKLDEVAPAQVLNVGNHSPVELREFLRLIEDKLGKKARVELLPMQSGDVEATYAEVSELQAKVDFRPDTDLDQGIDRSLTWYLDYRRKRGI